jgi:ABC-type transport system substrate-binding protein
MAMTAATTSAAAFLAACGSDSDDSSSGTGSAGTTAPEGSTGATSSLLSDKESTLDKAVRGGTFVWPNSREPLHLDGKAQGQVQLNHHNGLVYEALVRNKPGLGEPSTFSEVEPQLAESWEVSPDKLTITFKLREGVKWHNKPPVNGRPLDAEDVAVTWQKFETASTPNNKAANSHNVNPAAPVISITAPDSKTVVVNLSEPSSYIMQRLSSMITGEIGSIYPKEAGDTFDAKLDQIGTGAFILDHFTPSQEIVYRSNPDYWDKQAGFLNEVKFPLLPEYAAQLSQFKNGTLSSVPVTQLDVVPTKKEVPGLAMYAVTLATNNPGAAMRFGWLPIGDKPSPFLDIRVRQALSMSFDRDTHIDTFSNVSQFESDGLPVNTYWHTSMGYVPDFWLDPTDEGKFGANAKYYAYNVGEAKKLISAAQSSYPGGSFPEIPSYTVQAVFPPPYTQETEVMDQFAREIGLGIVSNPLDYNLDYLPNYVTKQGQFSGILYGIGATTSPDPTDYFVWKFWSRSGPTSGALGFGGTDGNKGDMSGDPQVDQLIENAKAEFDAEKRVTIIQDLQKSLAAQAYTIPRPGFADSFQLAWPAIMNFATFQGDSRVVLMGTNGITSYWYDTTRPHRA